MELNSCTREQLLELGLEDFHEALQNHRPFESLDEVLEVPGAERFPQLRKCSVEPRQIYTEGNHLQCYENIKLRLAEAPVLRAFFGVLGNFVDCTEAVQRLQTAQRPVIVSPGALGCDPAPGVWKQFRLELGTAACEVKVEAINKMTVFKSPAELGDQWVAFVRHAQAGHNVDPALIMNRDNALTEEGVAQALRGREAAAGEALRAADLVVTSPLTRAMQTTGLLMGDGRVPVRLDPGISERWSAPCDEGTAKSELRSFSSLPGLENMSSWQGWEELEEFWWPTSGEDQYARAEAFLAKARDMPQERLVFVGHGGFWDTVLGTHMKNCEVLFCHRALPL